MTLETKAKTISKQPVIVSKLQQQNTAPKPSQQTPHILTKQTVMFTIMARGVTLNTDTSPVSVYVSPRLFGAHMLGAYPDWLHWTKLLKEKGFTIEVQCGTQITAIQINRDLLQPELWEELFKDDTLVRPFDFPDYSNRDVLSYSVRQTFSALKATYQKAGLDLGLPDYLERDPSERRKSNRQKLTEMIDGLDVHWDGRLAPKWRAMVRIRQPTKDTLKYQNTPPLSGPLDSEGAIVAEPNAEALNKIALPFSVFHHMPTPEYKHNRDANDNLALDTKNLLDFHKVLSSLNSYPDLLRALGLVFDLELPPNFVQIPAGKYGTLWVSKAIAGWSWSVIPETPQLKTAYVLKKIGGKNLFCNAPRYLDDPTFPIAVIGLLRLNPDDFGLAQLDVDGGMHKTINLAETLHPSPETNIGLYVQPLEAPNPEVFDPKLRFLLCDLEDFPFTQTEEHSNSSPLYHNPKPSTTQSKAKHPNKSLLRRRPNPRLPTGRLGLIHRRVALTPYAPRKIPNR